MKFFILSLMGFLFAKAAIAGCTIQQTTPTMSVTDLSGTYNVTPIGPTSFTTSCAPDAGYDTITWAWYIASQTGTNNNQSQVTVDPTTLFNGGAGDIEISVVWKETNSSCQTNCITNESYSNFWIHWAPYPVVLSQINPSCVYQPSSNNYVVGVMINNQPPTNAPGFKSVSATWLDNGLDPRDGVPTPIGNPQLGGTWYYLTPTGSNPDSNPTYFNTVDSAGFNMYVTKPGSYSYSLMISSMVITAPQDTTIPQGFFGFFSNSMNFGFTCSGGPSGSVSVSGATASPATVIASLDASGNSTNSTVTLSASVSPTGGDTVQSAMWTVTDPNGQSTTVSAGTNGTATYSPQIPGTYSASLQVTGNQGQNDTASTTTSFSAVQIGSITSSDTQGLTGGSYTFTLGTAGSAASSLSYSWTAVLNGSSASISNSGSNPAQVAWAPMCNGQYSIQVVVSDGKNQVTPTPLAFLVD